MPFDCLTSGWKEIITEWLTPEQIQVVRSRLTIVNPAYAKAKRYDTRSDVPEHIHLYRQLEDRILVPRNWSNKTFVPKRTDISVPVVWPETSWQLREEQMEPYSILLEKKDGLICMPCGTGKSVVMLIALQAIGQRALVVSPTTAVTKQWIEYFDQIFNVVGGAKRITSKDFNPATYLSSITLQQLALHPVPIKFFHDFGVVIFDEVDVANAAQLSKALPVHNCLKFGLTATKRREDQMDILSDLHIGPVLYEMSRIEGAARPTIYVKYTGIHYNAAAPLPVAITASSNSPKKKDIVISYVQRALEKQRKIFVLCERIDQAEVYAKELSGLFPNDISLAHSKTKTKDYDKPVIVATNLLGRGFNKEDLDTLLITGIFLYSSREFRQLLGRIQRKKAGKKRLVVVILQDNSPVLDAKLRKILYDNKDLYDEVKEVSA